QMLTGELPFQAESVQELIRKQIEAPAQIYKLRPDAPVAIQQILVQMLAVDPRQRPHRASEVAAIIDQAVHNQIDTHSIPPAFISETFTGNRPTKRRPVGREAECAELQDSFESVTAGCGQLVCVTGEPGIGKTTVVEEFLDQVSADGKYCIV